MALLKIPNDIVCNINNGKLTALNLLDLSAAFGIIDHHFLQRLHRHFGISGAAFLWFGSYLSNRAQRINIPGSRSCPKFIPFGVPQGSVLGPVLFSLYTTSPSRFIINLNINHHLYADDTQVYISLSPTDTHTSISTVNDCLTDILSWLESSKLKLTIDKTYMIINGINQQGNKIVDYFPVKMIGNDTPYSDTVRNLGVVFDSRFSVHQYISNVCKSCFYHIRDFRRFRRHLFLSSAKAISVALINSRLDYCNSLLNNIAEKDLSNYKHQRVQRSSCLSN